MQKLAMGSGMYLLSFVCVGLVRFHLLPPLAGLSVFSWCCRSLSESYPKKQNVAQVLADSCLHKPPSETFLHVFLFFRVPVCPWPLQGSLCPQVTLMTSLFLALSLELPEEFYLDIIPWSYTVQQLFESEVWEYSVSLIFLERLGLEWHL